LSVIGFTLIVLTPTAWAADHNGARGSHRNRVWNLHHEIALPDGYLKVHSTRDEESNGAYYSYSSYEIYSGNGRLFKRVEHNVSQTGEIIPWEVPLPAGFYTIVGHSKLDGEVHVHFVIKTGERTILDLDLAEQEMYKRRFHAGDQIASSSE
jgi:hypothetical protein